MAHEAFLSQDEVDALLASVTGEASNQPATPASADASGVRRYDLGSPDGVVRRRMQTLELINERFARYLREAMLTFMRRSADIMAGPVQIKKYADFERNLPVPANLNMVNLEPLRGTALFAFDPNLVFLVIDSLFGSDGRYHMRVEGREFTQTEQRIIQRLLDLTLTGYTRAWQSVYPLTAQYLRSEMHTRFASITSANEAVVVTTFRIEFGAMGGDLNVCLPLTMIEPIRDLLMRPLQHHAGGIDQRWQQQLSRQVRSAEIELVAELARIHTRVGELARLQPGDVLPLEMAGHITASVDGTPVMQCGYGTANGQYALRVQQLLQPDLESGPPSDSQPDAQPIAPPEPAGAPGLTHVSSQP